jgi:thioesterase domain-containing protein/acyl carrier protein
MPLTVNGKVDRENLPSRNDDPELEPPVDLVVPRDRLERTVAEIWEGVLGTSPIGVTSNFFDLGGHSLSAVRLMARLQKRFGHELPLSTLMRASTVEEMAALIRQQTGTLDWSPVVPIQPAGSRPPFFCVHPVGGTILRYRDLARHLGTDQPFYGLEAPGLETDRNHFIFIEDLAAYYLEAVRRVVPEGPYLLGGHSFGGYIAFEMAQQLQKQGDQLGLLALLDTPSPAFITKRVDDTTLLAGRVRELAIQTGLDIRVTSEDLQQFSPEGQMDYVLDLVKRNGLVPREIETSWVRRFLEGLKARERAVLSYKPQSCLGRITLFRASQLDPETIRALQIQGVDFEDPTLGWGALSEEAVDVSYIPGFHETIVFEPNVRVLAEQLKKCIDRLALNDTERCLGLDREPV